MICWCIKQRNLGKFGILEVVIGGLVTGGLVTVEDYYWWTVTGRVVNGH
jgi:hypothetical protein